MIGRMNASKDPHCAAYAMTSMMIPCPFGEALENLVSLVMTLTPRPSLDDWTASVSATVYLIVLEMTYCPQVYHLDDGPLQTSSSDRPSTEGTRHTANSDREIPYLLRDP